VVVPNNYGFLTGTRSLPRGLKVVRLGIIAEIIQRDLSKLVELGLVKEVAKSKTDPTKYYELL